MSRENIAVVGNNSMITVGTIVTKGRTK